MLLEYPELLEAYERQVPTGINSTVGMNQTFWCTFLEKNIEYSTVPFGGNNPIFIPGVTDIHEYEGHYMDNQHSVGRSQNLAKELKKVIDVNFVQNLELD